MIEAYSVVWWLATIVAGCVGTLIGLLMLHIIFKIWDNR